MLYLVVFNVRVRNLRALVIIYRAYNADKALS